MINITLFLENARITLTTVNDNEEKNILPKAITDHEIKIKKNPD